MSDRAIVDVPAFLLNVGDVIAFWCYGRTKWLPIAEIDGRGAGITALSRKTRDDHPTMTFRAEQMVPVAVEDIPDESTARGAENTRAADPRQEI